MPASKIAYGQFTSPNASNSICSISAAMFTVGNFYKVDVRAYINGTVTAADDDNMTVNDSGGGLLQQFTVASGQGVPPARFSFIYLRLPAAAGGLLRVSALSAGTVGAVYHAMLVVTEIDFTAQEIPFPLPN